MEISGVPKKQDTYSGANLHPGVRVKGKGFDALVQLVVASH